MAAANRAATAKALYCGFAVVSIHSRRLAMNVPTPAPAERRKLQPEKAQGCRLCGHTLDHTFVNLGMSPLCESYLSAGQLNAMEPFYPLHVLVCSNCFLVQLREYVSAEHIFTEYAYFSSYSTSWVAHAKAYCGMIK